MPGPLSTFYSQRGVFIYLSQSLSNEMLVKFFILLAHYTTSLLVVVKYAALEHCSFFKEPPLKAIQVAEFRCTEL